jgi:hypothetical protein
MTFEDREGATLVTLVQGGFETEGDRDTYLSGATPFLEGFERAVVSRAAGPGH